MKGCKFPFCNDGHSLNDGCQKFLGGSCPIRWAGSRSVFDLIVVKVHFSC